MKVVNATWELRNLGKRTIELTLEKADFLRNPKEIYADNEAAEDEYQSEYTVVKVKTGKPQIGWELQKNGFWHIETQINLKASREDITYAFIKYGELFQDISFQKVETMMDVSYIQDEIRKGIFTTDRIALDPYFGIEISNRRYANWVEDEIKKNSSLFYVISMGEKIGFVVNKTDGLGLLGGLFTGFQKNGMGGELEIAGLRLTLSMKVENIYTSVSSNNLKILQLHELFGYHVKSLIDVYVKHDSRA